MGWPQITIICVFVFGILGQAYQMYAQKAEYSEFLFTVFFILFETWVLHMGGFW